VDVANKLQAKKSKDTSFGQAMAERKHFQIMYKRLTKFVLR
jgi:hypothetical protein